MPLPSKKWLLASLTLSITYLAGAGLYIIISSRLAASASADIQELESHELFKGLLFVGTTSVALFALAAALFRRIERAGRELLHSRELLLAAEHRAQAGLLAASVAHDFKNLLLVMSSCVAELREKIPIEPEHRETLRDLDEAVQRATELARRLSVSGRSAAASRKEERDLSLLVRQSVEVLRSHDLVKQSRVVVHSEGPIRAWVYPNYLSDAVINLVLNAAEARTGGQIDVLIAQDGDRAELVVDDDGPGIPPQQRAQVFDAFYTTKTNGTGLGLPSVKAAVDLHGGAIELTTSARGGARFRVTLPRNAPRPDHQGKALEAAIAPSTNGPG